MRSKNFIAFVLATQFIFLLNAKSASANCLDYAPKNWRVNLALFSLAPEIVSAGAAACSCILANSLQTGALPATCSGLASCGTGFCGIVGLTGFITGPMMCLFACCADNPTDFDYDARKLSQWRGQQAKGDDEPLLNVKNGMVLNHEIKLLYEDFLSKYPNTDHTIYDVYFNWLVHGMEEEELCEDDSYFSWPITTRNQASRTSVLSWLDTKDRFDVRYVAAASLENLSLRKKSKMMSSIKERANILHEEMREITTAMKEKNIALNDLRRKIKLSSHENVDLIAQDLAELNDRKKHAYEQFEIGCVDATNKKSD